MFIAIIFTLNLLLFAYILFYGACFLALPFVRPLRSDSQENTQEDQHSSSVAVLIPCHFEDESILHALDSILAQDYSGPLNINILIADQEDSSYPFLRERFPERSKDSQKKAQKKTLLFDQDNRRVVLHCCGVSAKRDKINLLLPTLDEEFVAFLDADHRANPGWIRRSVSALENSSYAGVQSRRAPLSLERLPQLWDSAQNHIGNELVNRALKKFVGAVFFTGTTCVYRRTAIADQLFGNCVAEDTYFCYELLAKGKLIDYLPETGSREEVAPDVRSYIARRRRWSCGHHQTFFTFGPSILRSKLPWRNKAATAIHGLFYTVPIAVCLLLNVYALNLFVQFTLPIQVLTVLAAIGVSYLVSCWLFGWHRSIGREMLGFFAQILPQITFLAPIVLYQMEHQLYYFLVSFPYLFYIFWTHLFCVSAPLLLLIVGHRKIDVLKWQQVAIVVVTYPLFFLLDLYSCTLGFVDYLLGKPTWIKIQRTNLKHIDAQAELANITTKFCRWIGFAFGSVALVIAANDLSAYSNCGKAKAYFFDPIFYAPKSEIDWKLIESKRALDSDTIEVSFASKVLGTESWELQHFINGQQLYQPTPETSFDDNQFKFNAPLGWQSYSYIAKLKSGREFCSREQKFTTTAKELRGKQLYVNDEEFLIKGVIPSFSPSQTEIEEATGYQQIKQLGANSLRFYHPGQERQRDLAASSRLLMINQPNRSTWDDANLLIPWDRILLVRRFKELIEKDQGNPSLLFHTLGNELEIRTPRLSRPKLVEMMNDIAKDLNYTFYSYSTFYVFLKLPSAILGVNMLDSSETYWKSGLDSIRALDQPFFASEFGGFVAATEKTPAELRAYRLFSYWEAIRKAGGMGLIIHQSHDNWSQPVINGFNDPFTDDQPDDVRGIWTRENQAKPIKKFVEILFSDLEAKVLDEAVSPGTSSFKLQLRNRRNFELRGIELFYGEQNKSLIAPLNLAAGESVEQTLQLPEGVKQLTGDPFANLLKLRADYTTHKGLPMVSQLYIPLPVQGDLPAVLNQDTLNLESSGGSLRGSLLYSSQLELLIPNNWEAAKLNGEVLNTQNKRLSLPLRPSLESAIELEQSADGVNWRPIAPSQIGKGPNRLRFKLPRDYPTGAVLLLAGLGTEKFNLRYGEGDWKERVSHKYRENLLDLKEIIAGKPAGQYFYLLLARFATTFIESGDHPTGKQVEIALEMPRVFSPTTFVLEKASL